VLGLANEAIELADQAISSAHASSDRPFTVELAVAHAARAEVAAFIGDSETALAEFAITEQQALGSSFNEVLLPTHVLWAKILAISAFNTNDAERNAAQTQLALEHVARAEPLLFALELDEHDLRRAELLEARGLSVRARGDLRAAIDLHREAEAIFRAAEQPTLAAKSLLNIGVAWQELGEPEQAKRAYGDAVALLEQAELPPSYRNRVQLEYNLGLLALEHAAASERINGVTHFEFVIHHGTPAEQLEALGLIIALALELDDQPLALRWAERALAELEAHPGPTPHEIVAISRYAGLALGIAGDLRGEKLLETAELHARELSPLVQFNIQRSWIELLESNGRCDEAHARRTALIASGYDDWRDAGPQRSCTND
jgi:tetratricopeptide (TPR) repeat protein